MGWPLIQGYSASGHLAFVETRLLTGSFAGINAPRTEGARNGVYPQGCCVILSIWPALYAFEVRRCQGDLLRGGVANMSAESSLVSHPETFVPPQAATWTLLDQSFEPDALFAFGGRSGPTSP